MFYFVKCFLAGVFMGTFVSLIAALIAFFVSKECD